MGSSTPREPVSVADLATHPAPYENFEVWRGEFVVRDSSGGWSALVAGRVFRLLDRHVSERALGWTLIPSQGFWIGRHPDTLLEPDVSFISKQRCPRVPAEGFIEIAPDFAVEVRSPTDAWASTLAKAGVWLAHGTSVVWAIDPRARLVVVLRGNCVSSEARPGAAVDAAPAFPDFRVEVASLFEGLEE